MRRSASVPPKSGIEMESSSPSSATYSSMSSALDHGAPDAWDGCGYHGTINCFIVRFDCALSRDVDDRRFKGSNLRFSEAAFLQRPMALPEGWKEAILQKQLRSDRETEGV